MNSKIKVIALSLFLLAGLSIGNFSTAASISVCGEVPAGTQSPPKDPSDQSASTPYDNYKAYSQWLINNPIPTFKDPANPTVSEQAALDKYYKARTIQEKKINICQPSDIFKQIARIINFLIGFIGLFVIFRLVVSGFQMVTAMGSEEKIKGARSGITNALIGMVLVFGAYVFVNIIFQLFGVKNFGINPFGN